MIGGNKKYNFYRAVESRDSMNQKKKCYSDANPLYEDVWCRKVRREPYNRIQVQTKKSSRPLIEELLLIVPIDSAVQVDDIAKEIDTGNCYLILGAEDVSRMEQTYQCPIVRVPGLTKETS